MRVWDIPVSRLCNKHLVAQHQEIHCIYSIIINDKKGFAHHPEVIRWKHSIGGLILVHDSTVYEMGIRGMNHQTPLPLYSTFDPNWGRPLAWQPMRKQIEILKSKGCDCNLEGL